MNDDELRTRLERLDPVPESLPMESPTSPSARIRLEQIMNNDTMSPRSHRLTVWLGAAAAAVAVTVGVVAVTAGGDDAPEIADPGPPTTVEPAPGPPLELGLPGSTSMASCIQFDTAILAGMSPAFAATATAVEGSTVTLTVDRWYTGGDAATVTLEAPDGETALMDGFAIEAGERYLITAAEGTVNFCGYSGPATPELTAAFEEAFAG